MSKVTGEGFNMKDFISFKFFITPQIIKVLWIITSIIGVIAGVSAMTKTHASPVLVILGIPVLLLAIRLIFESFMVLFAIVSLLRDLRDKQS